eukprot:scaffold198234_cov36-Tisochrysis_lutea.AAC.3
MRWRRGHAPSYARIPRPMAASPPRYLSTASRACPLPSGSPSAARAVDHRPDRMIAVFLGSRAASAESA